MKPEERAELLAAKIQTRFVDEPRKSVQEADALVARINAVQFEFWRLRW